MTVEIGAKEGTSISLLGLLEYNSQSDSFEITKVEGVMCGGLRAAKDYLKYQMDLIND